MARFVFVLFFSLFLFIGDAQNNKKFDKFQIPKDIFGTRNFIENKGQFDKRFKSNEKIMFALDNGFEKIYFSQAGLTYELNVTLPRKKEESESSEFEKKNLSETQKAFFVQMNWVDAQLNKIEVIASEKQSHYFTYGDDELNSYAFKKITYKNVYPFIDIEYTIPEEKYSGIKYTIIVNPGGDIKQVKFLYTGDVKKIKKDRNGELQVFSYVKEPIIEHKPFSYTDDFKEVDCFYCLNNDTLEFEIKGNYNKQKKLIIDPWITSVTNLNSNYTAYDVDFDYSGNTYIYGGDGTYKVAKYSSTGSLIWTFSGLITSNNWNSAPNPYVGNFCADKYSGRIFIGQGVNTTGTQIVRINSAGNYDSFISTPTSNYQEVWDMSINCTSGDVFTLGGGHNSNLSAATISNLNMNLSFATFQPLNLDPRQDVSSHCIDDNGNIFVIYSTIANLSLNDKICRVNSTFNGNVWTQPSTFSVMAEASNKLNYIGYASANSNGLNCLAVNSSYLFYYDGSNLAAYSKANGSKITSIVLAGTNPNEKGGIAVDDCNNLYLGGVGQILNYHFSGASFISLNPILLGSTYTSSVIFDIKLLKSTNTLYVCGSGFVSNLSASNSNSCSATNPICNNSYPVNYLLCGGGSATLTPNNSLNLSNPSYSVLPGPLSNTNGTFVVSPNTTTTYTTYVTGTNTNNAIVTLTSVSTVSIAPVFTWSPNPSLLILTCTQPSITINYIPPIYNYTTTNGTSSYQTGTSAVFTNTNYAGNWTVTAVDPGSGCTRSQTFSVQQSLIAGNSILSPTLQLITCSNTAISSVTSQITPSVNVQHIWMSPLGGSLVATSYISTYLPGAPGIYTHCAVNNSNGCTSIQTFTVLSNQGFPTFNVQSPQNFTLGCASKSLATINITNGQTSPPGGSILYNFTRPGNFGVSNFSGISNTITSTPGTWTIIVKDVLTNCESKVQISVLQNTFSPKLDTLIIPTTILNCDIPFTDLFSWSSTPNTSYVWSFPGTPGNIQSNTLTVNANTLNITNTLVANYTLTITDNNNACETKSVVPIAQNLFPPKAAVSLSDKAITCITNSITLTNQSSSGIPVSSGFPNSNFIVSASWYGPSPQTEAHLVTTYLARVPGTYTFIAKDLSNGCTSTAIATILDQIFYPSINIPAAPSPFILPCGSSSIKIVPNLVPENKFNYQWHLPSDSIVSGTTSQLYLTTTAIGIYTLEVTDSSNGCDGTGTVQVIADTLFASFNATPDKGYAILSVQFTNNSKTLSGNNNIKTYWNFANGISYRTDSINQSVGTEYTQAGTYDVTAFAVKGSCVDTAHLNINVELPSQIEIPNIFTPNDDGVNDLFFIQSSNIELLEISIIDRWGMIVYELKTEYGNISWNGKNQYGKELADGVYFYVLTAKGKDGKSFVKKGTVTLLR